MNTSQFTVVLSVIGTLFFIAMAFGILPWKIATFLGVACYVIAGAARRLAKPAN
jgi:hypothetical protein